MRLLKQLNNRKNRQQKKQRQKTKKSFTPTSSKAGIQPNIRELLTLLSLSTFQTLKENLQLKLT